MTASEVRYCCQPVLSVIYPYQCHVTPLERHAGLLVALVGDMRPHDDLVDSQNDVAGHLSSALQPVTSHLTDYGEQRLPIGVGLMSAWSSLDSPIER
jgi:hypothetical protein